MKIQIFIESNEQVLADRRFEIKDGQAPENIRESINEMIESIHNVENF